MAIRDAIVLNTTGSNFEALQSGDSVRIKGDSDTLLSIENSSETRVFSIDTTNTSVNIEGNVTSSKVISGSSVSTASFGRFEVGTFEGDAREIASTLPRSGNVLSGSSQIAGNVSGSFISGFTFGATADEYYVGVSGSNSSHSASISGSQRGMSVSGSVSNTLAALAGDLGDIQGSAGAGGTWSEGDALVASTGGANGGGTGNAGIIVGGRTPNRLCTQLYDGTSWSLGTAVPRNSGNANYGGGWGFGLQDSFIDFNSPSTDVQEYNGTAWSEVGNMSATSLTSDKSRGAGFNARTGIAMAVGSSPYRSTEHYNGTSWSSGGELISAGGNAHSGAGSEHSAMFILNSCVQEYDGSVWSLLNTQSFPFSGDAFGSKVDNVVAFGGSYGVSTSCAFDGTSWAATGNTIRGMMSSGGGTGGHNAGGGGFRTGGRGDSPYQYGGSTCTEHYNVTYKSTGSFGRIEAGYVLGNAEDIKEQIPRDAGLVTSSAQLAVDISGSFDEGFNYGVTTDQFFVGISGSSAVTAHSASVSGSPSSLEASGSDFDIFGSAQIRGNVGSGVWSAGGTMITARYRAYKGGTGLENAAIVVGSGPSEYSNDGPTEKYDGTSWSADGSGLNTTLRFSSLTGTQNAALSVGGLQTWTGKKNVEIYNGNVWTAAQNLPETSGSHIVFGTVNAASAVGMMTKDSHDNTYVYNFNGTSWSTPSVNVEVSVAGPGITGTHDGMAGGSQNAGISAAGYAAGTGMLNKAFTFDGTTFTQVGNLNTARTGVGGWGTANTALVVGGVSPGATSKTELWDGVAWTETTDAANSGGRGGGSAGAFAEAGISTPGTGYTEHWSGNFTNTGSFGLIKAGFLHGDAGNIGAALAYDSNLVSGSSQLATDISGSFTSGFNFGSSFESRFDGVSGSIFTPGVSGSSQFYSSSFGHPSLIGGVSGSHPSGGADYSHLKTFDSGHIRGIIGGGSWSSGASMINARAAFRGSGMYNSALVAMDQFAPHASSNTATEEYEGIAWAAGGAASRDFSRANQVGFVNAAVKWGGYAQKCETEEYNGTVWSNASNMSNGQHSGGAAGTQNAALAFQGRTGNVNNGICTEEYNGTSWSTSGAVGSGARYTSQGFGSQNSAVAFGNQANTHLYDGSAWSTLSGVAAAHPNYANGQSVGTQTGGLAFGGGAAYAGSANTTTFQFDGSVWSSVGTMITFEGHKFAGGAGDSHRSLAFGGNADSPYSAHGGGDGCTRMDEWDGNFINTGSFGRIEATYFNGDFTDVSASLFDGTNTVSSSAQIANDVSGSFTSGFGFGAQKEDYFTGVSGSTTTPGVSGSSAFFSSSYGHPTLLYESGAVSGSDYTHLLQSEKGHIRGTAIAGGTWTNVGSLITARRRLSTSGTTNATVAFGGSVPSTTTCTELWNGSTWSSANAMINSYHNGGSTGIGVYNAALRAAGAPSTYGSCCTDHWDGTNWSAGGTIIQRRFDTGNAGTVNAALLFGGRTYTPSLTAQTCTEEYNGTSWSETGASGPAFPLFQGGGLQNAAFAFLNTDHDQYDGTTWSEAASLSIGKSQGAAAGTVNSTLSVGGLGSPHALSLHYDGTSWSSGGSLGQTQYQNAGNGIQSAALAVGGGTTPGTFLQCTEVYDAPFTLSGSFGRVEATHIVGDASEISSALLAASPVKTSSEAFQSEISGSIKGGIDLKGPLTSQPIGAWSMANPMINGRAKHVQVGGKHASMVAGGQYGAAGAGLVERWDGAAWSVANPLPMSASHGEAAGDFGSELLYKGKWSGSGDFPYSHMTWIGDGLTWSQGANTTIDGQNSYYSQGGNVGTQNAALSTYQTEAGSNRSEEYDGTSWMAHAFDVPHGALMQKTGVINAALIIGGSGPNSACNNKVSLWDGVSYSTVNSLNNDTREGSAAGTVNDGMTTGGYVTGTYKNLTELWDGVSWSNTGATGAGNTHRSDGNGSSAGTGGVMATGQHSVGTCTQIWDVYYGTSGSFGRAEPKYGIVTERFELKNKNIDDNNTVLLIHSNTINDSVVFSGSMGDSSLSNHSMSFSGSVKHTSSFAQFGRTSIYFGGSGSLEVSGSGTENRDLEFGNNEFTIEYWVRQDTAQTAKTVFRKPGSYVLENETDVNNIIFKFNESASISVSSNYTSSVDLWNHVAVVRHEDTLNMYINGKLRDTRANMTESMGSYGNSLFIGDADSREGTDTAFTGYIDEFRISNIARYNTEFVPEEGEIQRIGSGSSPDAPFNHKKDEAVTFKLPQFTNFDQPAILTQTLFQTNFSSSLSSVSGSRTGRSGSAVGGYYEEKNIGTVAGDMWFNKENNSLNFTFESSSYSGGSWSAGGDLPQPHTRRGGTGVQDAAVVYGRCAETSSAHYDGAAWSISSPLILPRVEMSSAGSQNAALAIGGYATPFTPGMCTQTEKYDGATWSEVADVITGRKNADGAGAQNAALFIGGCDVAAGALSNKTEHYNGSSWSAGGALIIARQVHVAAGEEFAALAIGGKVPSVTATMEEYDGSVWSTAATKNVAKGEGAGDGGVSGALFAGSGVSPYGQTEEYNGVSWIVGPVLITGRQDLDSASTNIGKSGKGLVFAGRTPGVTVATEEYTCSGVRGTLVVCALTGSQA